LVSAAGSAADNPPPVPEGSLAAFEAGAATAGEPGAAEAVCCCDVKPDAGAAETRVGFTGATVAVESLFADAGFKTVPAGAADELAAAGTFDLFAGNAASEALASSRLADNSLTEEEAIKRPAIVPAAKREMPATTRQPATMSARVRLNWRLRSWLMGSAPLSGLDW